VADNFYPTLKRLLEKAGCTFVRSGAGSHETWFSPKTGKHFTVPRGCKRRHTANGILKDAGIGKKL
jgi:predicted RNA binding protein YcfA (HicA-like mRNA interferase family)